MAVPLVWVPRGGLEPHFDRAVEQEGERSDEDVGLHTLGLAVIDRPQIDHSEGPFHFGQIFVEGHRLMADRRGSSLWMTYLPS